MNIQLPAGLLRQLFVKGWDFENICLQSCQLCRRRPKYNTTMSLHISFFDFDDQFLKQSSFFSLLTESRFEKSPELSCLRVVEDRLLFWKSTFGRKYKTWNFDSPNMMLLGLACPRWRCSEEEMIKILPNFPCFGSNLARYLFFRLWCNFFIFFKTTKFIYNIISLLQRI